MKNKMRRGSSRWFGACVGWCLWSLGLGGGYGQTAVTETAGLRLQRLGSNARVEAAFEARETGAAAGWMRVERSDKADAAGDTALRLPFADDFSYAGPYPDSRLWQDRSVFVNNDFPFFPPTYGVATFDAMDEKGALYHHGGLGVSFSADTLTSRPIRLDSVFGEHPRALTTADSIILSFYYQPGGGWGNLWDSTNRGQCPNASDRLVLEFYSEELSMWVRMWGSDGLSLSEFCPLLEDGGTHSVQSVDYFRYVEVPISTPGFNKPDFRFRFRAYSSVDRNLRTGGGQWHIDNVYLNCGRVPGQAVADVAFVDGGRSLTGRYTQVPWRQFDASHLRSGLDFTLTNLGDEPATVTYRCVLRKISAAASGTGGTEDTDAEASVLWMYPDTIGQEMYIYPFEKQGYVSDPVLSPVNLAYGFGDLAEADGPQTYRLSHIVTSALADVCPRNDTLTFTQTFGDEFAYDDGTSEAGIGPTYAGGAMAVCFELQRPDTLTSLRLFFNRSYHDANVGAFTICVWRAVLGDRGQGYVPDALLYEGEVQQPVLENGYNRFHNYDLAEGGLLLSQGRYFIGIRQSTGTFLNLGFDQNNGAMDKTFYYRPDAESHGWAWRPLMYHGALMMRPAFGMAARQPVANEGAVRRGAPPSAQPLRVYPNPLRGEVLHIALPEGWSAADTYLQLSTVDGRLCRRENFRAECPVGGLERGVYVLRLVGADGRSAYAKIVIP